MTKNKRENHIHNLALIILFLAFTIFFIRVLPAPVFTSATLRGIYELSPDGPYQVLYEYRGQVQERIFKKFYEAAAFGESLLNSQAR
jgi:hypothetical protein